MILNPGGPGGSGIELVGYAPMIFGSKLLDNYNLLGFDPRGVGQSSAVACYDTTEMDRYLALTITNVTDKTLPVYQEEADRFAEACKDNTGDLLGHVDTINSARDMDLLRALMGDEKPIILGTPTAPNWGRPMLDCSPRTWDVWRSTGPLTRG